ncbi:MAG: DUF2326 domain-containing protein [Candidatus Gracilibacteria bacterium]|nr:DUF2326 domain-containing protein [Candidatus Gracilibacteria bacterium]
MYLKRIYSVPDDILPPVDFIDGVNFVYGKKQSNDPKNSLNGIGKPTFFDLIDFCLLSSFVKSNSSRLFSANHLLKEYAFTLEFEIDGINYQITRSIASSKEVIFGEIGKELNRYTVSEAKEKLCDLIFKNISYSGKYSNKWFRKLMPFFLKIQRFKKDKFIDPVGYIPESGETELNQYNFFLLGIDNTISKKNFDIQTEIKKRKPAIHELKKFIEETYGLKNISEVISETTKIKSEISNLEKALSSFKLESVYNNAELSANKLTIQIKELYQENILDRKKIFAYQESYKNKSEIDVNKVVKIYKELNESLSVSIKKTLNDAIKFRAGLARSREEFIRGEIAVLQQVISVREGDIREAESKRLEIFNFLQAKEALKDLTEGFNVIGKKRQILSELESKVKVFDDFRKEEFDLKVEEKNLEKEALAFIIEIRSQIENFRKILSNVYDSLYPVNKNKSIFDIILEENTQPKLKIKVEVPAMFSKGKNQGRTLVYDLAVLINGIRENIRIPRFLIHDGIFDGVDKAHFVALLNYLNSLEQEGIRFQYIVSLNEEGTLNEKFGDGDNMVQKQIEDRAIIKLSGTKKLFKADF